MFWHFLLWENRAAVSGRQIRDVTCEKCQTQYHYELVRTGTGTGLAVLGKTGAHKKANWQLQQRLEQDAEMVPCPTCGWVNHSLIKAYRRSRYRRLPCQSAIIILVGLFAALSAAAGVEDLIGGPSVIPLIAFLAVLAPSLTSPLWILAVRHYLRQRIDPNRLGEHGRQLPAGTPPALIDLAHSPNGERSLVPVPRRHQFLGEQEGWAVFVPARDRLPGACCVCMKTPDTRYQSPFKLNKHSDFGVPLCRDCAAKIRRRWWWTAAATTAASLGFFQLLALAVPDLNRKERGDLFFAGAVIGTILALVFVPGGLSRPYRLRCIDKDRGIYLFRASNPAYTRLLAEQVQQSGG